MCLCMYVYIYIYIYIRSSWKKYTYVCAQLWALGYARMDTRSAHARYVPHNSHKYLGIDFGVILSTSGLTLVSFCYAFPVEFCLLVGMILVRFWSDFGTVGVDFGVILSSSGSILVSFCDPRAPFWHYFGVLGGLLATLGPQGTPEGGRVEKVTENTVRVYTSGPPNGTQNPWKFEKNMRFSIVFF
jgi:hypothetical protein